MSIEFPSYDDSIFNQFITIDPKDYRKKINFYDRYQGDIEQLDFLDQYTINIELAFALFHIGSYPRFLSIVDSLIETSIIENIKWHDGVDVYKDLLFKKAASLFNLENYEACEKVAGELLKMDPSNEVYSLLYRNSILIQKSNRFKLIQATGILVFFTAIVVSFLELTVVKIFFTEYANAIIYLRCSLYILGILLMVINEGWHYLKARKKVVSITKK